MMDFEAEARIQALRDELETVRSQAAENEQKYLRCLAEMENYKKRLERSHTELARSNKKALFVKTLNVLDNLDRAISYEDTAREDPENLIKGLRLTYWQLSDLLGSEGVKPIEALGKPFDPHLHEAVDIDVSGNSAPGVVTSELQKGYYYQDEVLRPAKVRVAAAMKGTTL
ncbi:MAG TPA: nucleotide exchange factor GrpE [Chloroflexota bacterium]|nr:nucleotide exchange factor GrpE [Chloroflexota bacterium]